MEELLPLLERIVTALEASNTLCQQVVQQNEEAHKLNATWQNHVKRIDEELLDIRRREFARVEVRDAVEDAQLKLKAQVEARQLRMALDQLQQYGIEL